MERDLFTCCRICFIPAQANMKSTHDQWDENLKLIDLLNFLTDMEEDTLKIPNWLCFKCEEHLVQAYTFKLKCIKSSSEFLNVKEKFLVEMEMIDRADNIELEEELTEVVVEEISDQEEILGATIVVDQISSKSVKTHSCLKCVLTFDTYKDYQNHYRLLHRKKLLCFQCGKLISRFNFEKHQHTHNPVQHICEECGKSFTLLENLKKHIRIHTQEYRYECEHCGKKFIHWNSMKCHVKMHTGEKNHKCQFCGNSFISKSNLLRHIRYHTGEMRHNCPHCTKKFNTTSELKNHLVTHTKEKNEICEVCSKAFGTRKALRSHLLIHTGERNYMCTVCKKNFTQAHVLRTHMKSSHPDIEIPPPGTVLSQKRLQKLAEIKESHEIVTLSENTI